MVNLVPSKEKFRADKPQRLPRPQTYVESVKKESKQKQRSDVPVFRTYYVKDDHHVRRSESALVIFAQACNQNEPQARVVIKVLCDYEDTRYDLKDPQKRVQCQLQALQWNQKFTPKLFLGMCRVITPNLETLKQKSLRLIEIGTIISRVEDFASIAEEGADYALIMECLPKERRLDLLLKKKDIFVVERLLSALVERIVLMHKHTTLPTDFYIDDTGEAWAWGSFQQIEKKLKHNINLFENLQLLPDRNSYEKYFWLKDALLMIIKSPLLPKYFETRRSYVKRCHGDLKARNIWINSLPDSNRGNDEQYVRVLDAIDFNPSYCNIDVLSDIAMLAVDVQAVDTQLHERTSSNKRGKRLADFIIERYLELSIYKTRDLQEGKILETLITYYMLEKAIVRGVVSLYFDRDDHPQLGRYFLDIAIESMYKLDRLLGTTIIEKWGPQRASSKMR